MALPATLYRFDLRIVHAEQGLEHSIILSAARHPSETIERLWLRVVAAGWFFEEGLVFGPGLSEPDAPDLLAPGPLGRPSVVVRVGNPKPERVDRDLTANHGARVAVLFDSPRRLSTFVKEADLLGFSRLSKAKLTAIDPELLKGLCARDERRTKCILTFVEGHLYAEVDGKAFDGSLIEEEVGRGVRTSE